MDAMIDLEGLATGPDTTILTIAAVEFDPLQRDRLGRQYYVRVDMESQRDRRIEQDTLDWWATQPAAVKDEAFSEHDRVSLADALIEQLKMYVDASQPLTWVIG